MTLRDFERGLKMIDARQEDDRLPSLIIFSITWAAPEGLGTALTTGSDFALILLIRLVWRRLLACSL